MYALYHGDTFIDLGTKEYLANLLQVKIRTIDFYMSPVWKKRSNYNGYLVIRVED